MRIRKVTLQNFRTFKDLELDFEKDKTIIFAGSGKGKTTLKEAILMGLHANRVWNEVFDDVKKVGDIENLFTKGILEDSLVTTLSIKLELVDEEYEYFIEQSLTMSANKINTKRFNAITKEDNYFQLNASKRSLTNAGDNDLLSQFDIEMMFPLELAKILFFSGEIERLSDSKDLKNTLYDLFDLNKYEKASKILEKVKKDYDREVASSSTGELKKCAEEKLKNQSRIEHYEGQLDRLVVKLEKENARLKELDTIIDKQKDAKEYNFKRKTYENESKIVHESLENEIKIQARKLISKDKNSMCALRKNLKNIFDELNSESNEKRFISGINQSAIDQILEEHVCICGTHLTEEGIEYLKKIRDSLPPNEIGAFKSEIHRSLNSTFEEISIEQYDEHIIRLSYIESEISKLSNLIKNNVYNEEIEIERNELMKNIGANERDIRQAKKIIENLTENNKKLEVEEMKYIKDNEKMIVIRKKIMYVDSLIIQCKQDYRERQNYIVDEVELQFYRMLKNAEVEKEFAVGRIFDKNNLKLKVAGFSEGQKTMLNTFLMLSVLRVSLENNTKLPAILDGFISKQGLELTKKTMSIINQQENQLILFTLDKDKDYVNMDKSVAKYYELKREATDNFSRIEEC